MNDIATIQRSRPQQSCTLEALRTRVGQPLGCSGWMHIAQSTIDHFAHLTNDHNFIHVDPEMARNGPFGTTIAHGMLTLSLLVPMAYEVCPEIEGATAILNYGFDKIRFTAPVPSETHVRAHFKLVELHTEVPSRVQLHYRVKLEVQGKSTPALIANWVNVALF